MLHLPELKFSRSDLEPYMSTETIDIHYGKHHATYVQKANDLLADEPELNGMQLKELVIHAWSNGMVDLFNNAAQHWNHCLFWSVISPASSSPSPELSDKIISEFSSIDSFKQQVVDAGLAQFGSGWIWVVLNKKLKIMKTPNGENPLVHGIHNTLFGIDVWEHSYYLDHRNDRKAYIASFMDHLLDWNQVNKYFNKYTEVGNGHIGTNQSKS